MFARQKRFEEDVIKAKEVCKTKDLKIQDLEVIENGITFTVYNEAAEKRSYSMCISEDYPENTFVSCADEPEYSKCSHSPIPTLIQAIHDEFVGCRNPSLLSVPLAQRSVSMESAASNYSDCKSNMESESDEEVMDDYYDNVEDMEPDIAMNPVLAEDMNKLTSCYGDSVLSYRLLDSIDEIDVEINFPLFKFLEKEISEAWKLNKEEPLIVRLHLSLNSYLDTPAPPRVEVFQTSKKEFGVPTQMKKILENFLSEQWAFVSNELIKKVHINEREKKEVVNKTETDPANDEVCVLDSDIARIMEMGFSAEHAKNALILNHGDLLGAINELMSRKDRNTNVEEEEELKQSKRPKYKSQTSHPPMLRRKKKDYSRQKSSIPATSHESPDMTHDDLTLVPTSTWFGKNSKRIPPNDLGFLVQVFQYIRQRLPTLNEYCVVCDEPHVFQNGAMLKPAVCSRELCVFAFQTLGVMADAAEDIATGAEVVDLLVAMTKAACKSHRKKVIFDPYPTVVDPRNPRELSINPSNKDYEKVERVCDNIMSISEMSKLGSGDIKKKLDEQDILAYPLLQWIITSNRSHIVKLHSEKQLSFMFTSHQFLLMSSPPAKEARFRKAKQSHGSTFAFHGSGIENWHSIIREGLIVASGTTKQVNGAAYGKGIYLSPIASTSFGYSRMGYGYHNKKQVKSGANTSRFLSSANISCIALCEVINSSELKKSGSIWVCPNPDHVCTRFFFVYEDGQVGDINIDTQQEKYLQEIQKVISFNRMP